MPLSGPPPVSYVREVAPLLALRCYSCHGDSGGFSLRTYGGLIKGGNLGAVVVAGDAERSLLIHFLEGRRGEDHRMPLGGQPLDASQILTVRRWIDEGAHEDGARRPVVRDLRDVPLPAKRVLRVTCLARSPVWLTMQVLDPLSKRELFADGASVKSPKERGDSGVSGTPIFWDIRSGLGWPPKVLVRVKLYYSKQVEITAELLALR